MKFSVAPGPIEALAVGASFDETFGCPNCLGSGSDPLYARGLDLCSACRGAGEVTLRWTRLDDVTFEAETLHGAQVELEL